MRIPFVQIDAFAERAFGGNPAAVMPLAAWLADDVLQQIASENNLSETAFIVPHDGEDADFDLRWFTPAAEVALCGHATLASGHFVLSSDAALTRCALLDAAGGHPGGGARWRPLSRGAAGMGAEREAVGRRRCGAGRDRSGRDAVARQGLCRGRTRRRGGGARRPPRRSRADRRGPDRRDRHRAGDRRPTSSAVPSRLITTFPKTR